MFNDLACQRCQGGLIRSLAARNYVDFFGGGVYCLINCSFKFVISCCLIVVVVGKQEGEKCTSHASKAGGYWEVTGRSGGEGHPRQKTTFS